MSQTSFVAGFKVNGATARVAGWPERHKALFPGHAQKWWKVESPTSQPLLR
ncbi:MAG: hypothetical protein KL840_25000 [Aquamicrobium sp.]|nr:hypothetical protein [Aquamicrobium sp.]